MKGKPKQYKKTLLSVIVPTYNQPKTIAQSINQIESSLKKGLSSKYDYEVIVVVDGILDKTFTLAKRAAGAKTKVVGYRYNYGKGYALRYGMARSNGTLIAFIDGGADLNPNGIQMLLAHYEWYNADIIVGSKWHPVSIVVYPWWRKIISKGYYLFVKLLFGIRVKDTQLGMKLFRREVLEDVLPRLLVKKYACDIELLAVARRLGYARIFEAPVELNWSAIDSSVSRSLLWTIRDMVIDTLAVFYRLRLIKYYDDESKRKWRYDPDLNFKVNIG